MGRPDLALARRTAAVVVGVALLATGPAAGGAAAAPTFAAPVEYALDTEDGDTIVNGVGAADLNGDGHLDVAAGDTDALGRDVSVLFGTGGGALAPAERHPALPSHLPDGLVVAELNDDERPDLVVTGTAGGSDQVLAVLLNDGAGRFPSVQTHPTPGGGRGVLVLDVTRDGKPDLVTGSTSGVMLLEGDGAGGFGAPATTAIGGTVRRLAAGDVTGDGIADVVATRGDNAVVLAVRADGGFAPPQAGLSSPGFRSFVGVALARIDGDAHRDLVYADVVAPNGAVLVAAGNGDGTFDAPQERAGIHGPGPSLLAEDLDFDGHVDVVGAEGVPGEAGSVLLFAGTSALALPAPARRAVPAPPRGLALADMDVDGAPDLLEVDGSSGGTLRVYRNETVPPGQKPTLATLAADEVTASGMRLRGTVTPHGLATQYHFEWGTAPNALSSSSPVASVQANGGPQDVTQPIGGLEHGTEYFYRLVATNAAGTTTGSTLSTATPSRLPDATLVGTSDVTTVSARLRGQVRTPEDGRFHFEYRRQGLTDWIPTDRSALEASPEPQAAEIVVDALRPGTTYEFRLVAENDFGADTTAPSTFKTATLAPPAPSLTQAPPHDGGVHDLTPQLAGKGGVHEWYEDEVTVRIWTGPSAFGDPLHELQTALDGDGDWTVETPTLVEGTTYTVRVDQESVDGVTPTGSSPIRRFTPDLTSPTVSIGEPIDGSTVGGANPLLRGGASRGRGDDATVTLRLHAGPSAVGPPVASATVAANDVYGWQHQFGARPAGQYTLRVEHADWAGHSAGAESTFTIRTAPPSLAIDSPEEGAVLPGGPIAVRGTADHGEYDGDRVTVALRRAPATSGPAGGSVTAEVDPATGAWSAALPEVGDGAWTIVATLPDDFGRTGTSAPVHVEVDGTGPGVVIDGPDHLGAHNAPFVVRGTANRGHADSAVDVALERAETAGARGTPRRHVDVGEDGAWETTVDAPEDGDWVLVVTQTDELGREASARRRFTMDRQAPALGIADIPPVEELQPRLTGHGGTAAGDAPLVSMTIREKLEGDEAWRTPELVGTDEVPVDPATGAWAVLQERRRWACLTRLVRSRRAPPLRDHWVSAEGCPRFFFGVAAPAPPPGFPEAVRRALDLRDAAKHVPEEFVVTVSQRDAAGNVAEVTREFRWAWFRNHGLIEIEEAALDAGDLPPEGCAKSVTDGPVVYQGCLEPSGPGRWTASANIVRMNGLVLDPGGGSLVVDTRSHKVTSTRAVDVRAGADTVAYSTLDIAVPQRAGGSFTLAGGDGDRSRLKGMPIRGAVNVFVRERQAFHATGSLDVFARSKLPPGIFANSVLPSATFSFETSNDQGLKAGTIGGELLPMAFAKAFNFGVKKLTGATQDTSIKLVYDTARQRWTTNASLGFPQPFPYGLLVKLEFDKQGTITQFGGGVSGLNVPVGPMTLNELSAAVGVQPFRLDGKIGLLVGPEILGTKALGANGRFAFTMGPPWSIRVSGDARLMDFVTLASSYLELRGNGAFLFGGRLGVSLPEDADIPLVELLGGVDGWIQQSAFNVDGFVGMTLLGISARGSAVLSTEGIAACAQSSGAYLGFGYGWRDKRVALLASSCDLGRWRAVMTARAAQAALPITRTLPRGRNAIRLEGDGAPPAVLVTGPDGLRVQATADQPNAATQGAIVLRDPSTNTTYVSIGDGGAAPWTVTPLPGSVPIRRVSLARELSEPKVGAAVRNGRLHYRVAPVEGQRVSFSVAGPGGAYELLGAASGAAGSLRMQRVSPAAGRRRIVAHVAQDGVPRREIAVLSYHAGPEPGPGAPRVHRARIGRDRVVVDLRRRAANAARHVVAVRLAGGANFVTGAPAGRRRIAIPVPAGTRAASVTVRGVDEFGREGAAARVAARRRR